MSTSTSSDHEMSESSSSPHTYSNLDSPYSSPSQNVRQITNTLTELTCGDKVVFEFVHNGPYLRIVEQPQNHFRFRYVSEMVGTHGCLLGKTSGNNKTKTHPTVELVNYPGRALIRCQLAQFNSPEEHPHKLQEEEQDRDVSYIVPEQGSYKVGFPGMGIIHTAKKDVSNLLMRRMMEQLPSGSYNTKELKVQCDNKAKSINLNIVRLKFSAHDVDTGNEICEPVFSDPIHNMKSAATNDLKICRISMYSGRPRGGEDVFILVEKVNKKNIMIRFYEEDPVTKERVWSANATFLQSDVHHQYAIVFRTPQYKNPQTTGDVKVFIELVRPSDGRFSEPKEFTYKAEEVFKQIKKRKNNSFSSIGSSSGGSLSDLPVTVTYHDQQSNDVKEEATINFTVQPQPYNASSPTMCELGSALGAALSPSSMASPGPMWNGLSETPLSIQRPTALPQLHLDSAELNNIPRVGNEDNVISLDVNGYLSSFDSNLDDIGSQMNDMSFIRAALATDSDRQKSHMGFSSTTKLIPDSGRVKVEPTSPSKNTPVKVEPVEKKSNADYPAFYEPEDALEVKKLVKDLCDIIRNKKGHKNLEVRAKLERLFQIRLSNGDTFLHMTLCSNEPSFERIVRLIHSVRMSHLLNYANHKKQTILHLAVVNGALKIIPLLIAKGCNPKLKDIEEDNAIHYAVKYDNSCLEPLLDAIKTNNVSYDLNAYNSEKQTALHLCALYDAADSVAKLLSLGASYNVRDMQGRTPLHLCAYNAKLSVARALLQHILPADVDAVDGNGNTALQIVCGLPLDKNSVEMVQLLLEKKADPLKHEDRNESAWKLSRDKPPLRSLMSALVSCDALEDDVKSEPEDEYESADDDMDGAGLVELNAYIREVATRVEAAGMWEELARRLRVDALLSWFTNQPSPAYTMLLHVKECRDDISSKSLALILEDMGLIEAANAIRSHIEQ